MSYLKPVKVCKISNIDIRSLATKVAQEKLGRAGGGREERFRNELMCKKMLLVIWRNSALKRVVYLTNYLKEV